MSRAVVQCLPDVVARERILLWLAELGVRGRSVRSWLLVCGIGVIIPLSGNEYWPWHWKVTYINIIWKTMILLPTTLIAGIGQQLLSNLCLVSDDRISDHTFKCSGYSSWDVSRSISPEAAWLLVMWHSPTWCGYGSGVERETSLLNNKRRVILPPPTGKHSHADPRVCSHLRGIIVWRPRVQMRLRSLASACAQAPYLKRPIFSL